MKNASDNGLLNDYSLPDYIQREPQDTPRKILKIKDFDLADRPQEKAMEHGCSTLAIPDLLALLLRSGQPGIPITDLTRTLMHRHGNNLHNLERTQRKQLMLEKGVGTVKALQIEALFELIRRYNMETPEKRPRITGPDDIFDIMQNKIGNLPHEEIWALYLNRRNEVTSLSRITAGSSTASVFDAKKVIREALLNFAEGVILCHNHPSGTLRPSPQDDNMTNNFKEACRYMELRFLDHLIVTSAGYYSYSQEGKI